MSASRDETFRWRFLVFDIAKLNEDLRLGVLSGNSVTLPRGAIEWFSEHILGLKDPDARLIPEVPLIDRDYAKTLTTPRSDQPIVLIQLLRRSTIVSELGAGLDVPGALCYEPHIGHILKPANLETADVVLVDGNHRLASAYYQCKQSIHAVLLQESQTRNYLRNEP